MATDLERLDEANACHDDEPERGAGLLRAIDPAQLPPERWPNYAFLLNHVLGEKLMRWDDAARRQRALLQLAQPAPATVLWRQAATAARLDEAASGALAQELAEGLAASSGASLACSIELLQLNAVMYTAPGMAAARVGGAVLAALQPLASPAWQHPHPLDSSVAICANNIASALLERPPADLAPAQVRAALAQAAEQAHRFWLRAGNWLNHERALYLRAMVCNTLSEPQAARSHALAALALLDAHDMQHAEDVDRAFIELERAHAAEQLSLSAEAAEARALASRLVAQCNDTGIERWFARRTQALKLTSAA